MFLDLFWLRYWNSLSKSKSCILILILSVCILSVVLYQYIVSLQYIERLEIIQEMFTPLNSNSNQIPKQSKEFDLEKFLNKYPKIEGIGKGCSAWKCQPAFNTTTDSWISNRVGRWKKHHESQNKELLDPQQQCEYIWIGDSITAHWNDQSYRELFDSNFNTNHNGVIYAHSGDIISDIGWRLKHGDGFKNMKQCLSNHSLPRKSMILNIGTNNVGWSVGAPYDLALRDYEALLNQLIDFLDDINKQQNVVLNVMAIFPRGWRTDTPCPQCEHWNGNSTLFYGINFMNEFIKSFIDRQDNDNIKFIDCNPDLLQQIGKVDWVDVEGESHQFVTGYINTTILKDRLHLSAKGYELWTECLKRHLR